VIAVLLIAAAAAAQTPVDAERAFAAMAQTQGQWTAFRAYAAPDAIMFVPKPGNAQAFLKDRKDPKSGVMWWPGRSWISCDGTLAVNTGPWVLAGGKSTGTFTTVWQKQADGGWKWLLDNGRDTPRAVAAPERPPVTVPTCRNLGAARSATPADVPSPALVVQTDSAMPSVALPKLPVEEGDVFASGQSPDASFRWEARNLNGGEDGAHSFRLWLWNGQAYRLALFEVSGVKVP